MAFVSGQVPTAAELNAIITDVFTVPSGGTGAWTSYTPTLTQSATVTKTVNHAVYTKIGRLVIVTMYLTVTGAGVANNAVTIGLPVAAARSGDVIAGGGWLYDQSAGTFYSGAPLAATTTTANLWANAVAAAMGQTGGSFTAALASSDQIRASFQYEAAS